MSKGYKKKVKCNYVMHTSITTQPNIIIESYYEQLCMRQICQNVIDLTRINFQSCKFYIQKKFNIYL